jgi:uncharacterized protein YbaR (Trm112 family)
MKILACPIDKSHPLVLFSTREEQRQTIIKERVFNWVEIVDGVLYCPNCKRWYPIIDEIPELLPDELRDKERELAFLLTQSNRIPEDITKSGKPFNLG